MKKVAVSIHAKEHFNLRIIKGLKDFDYFHIDVMDGHFVEPINLNLKVFKILRNHFDIPIIAHLMVDNPIHFINKLINYVEYFVFHYECDDDLNTVIERVREKKTMVGIALNPPTNISKIIPYLNLIDIVLIMTVNPGWSGQEFIPEVVEKINRLADYKQDYNFQIDVDGGVNLENAKQLKNADILSSASTILNSEEPNQIIQLLKSSDSN
ncbi:MAG: ribulose-phosphate 3-epimerase [Candidatus Thorarchaeota archaeon]